MTTSPAPSQVCKWCDDGIYLLASQQLDKCQSQEGAESALQELEGYIETANELQHGDVCLFSREYESVLNIELTVRSTHENGHILDQTLFTYVICLIKML